MAVISNKLHLHPKVLQARKIDAGSMGLWLLAHSWCRSHRAKGRVPYTVARELGSDSEIAALLECGLWADDGDYVFHDWGDWNPEDVVRGPVTSAAWIVQQVLPDHPQQVRDRLAVEVKKLIEEGIARPPIEAGLKTWGSRADARVTWLPYFVSDAIREGESGVHAAIRTARETLNMTPLVEFGFRWQEPDVPDGMRVPARVKVWMKEQKLAWLNQVEARVRESAER